MLTGRGPAFCVGADLKEVLAGAKLEPGEPDFLDRASVVFDLLRNFAKPVIAALNGVTMAGRTRACHVRRCDRGRGKRRHR